MRQLIIARKDLNMSHGKLAAQVSHGSMAFLTSQMRRHPVIPDKCDYISWNKPKLGEKYIPDDAAEEVEKEKKSKAKSSAKKTSKKSTKTAVSRKKITTTKKASTKTKKSK